jgi:hypothetical protein
MGSVIGRRIQDRIQTGDVLPGIHGTRRHGRGIMLGMTERQQKAKDLVDALDAYYRWHAEKWAFQCLDPIYSDHPMFPIMERVKSYQGVLPDGQLPEPGRKLWAEVLSQSNYPPSPLTPFFELFMEFRRWVADNGIALKPRWDAKGRELWFDDQLVKKYTRAAPVQELVWQAFEEQGWPSAIDNPVSHQLADTIKDIQKFLQDSPFAIERDGNKSIRWRPR